MLKKLYKHAHYFAYDLRNFMGYMDGLPAETISVDNFKLKNGVDHGSLLFHSEKTHTKLYIKVYEKVARLGGKNVYDEFYQHVVSAKDSKTSDDQFKMVFDWLDTVPQDTYIESPQYSPKAVNDEEINQEIAQYYGKSLVTSQYIPAIYTLLPKILSGEIFDVNNNIGNNGKIISNDVVQQIRRTFKRAIIDCLDIDGNNPFLKKQVSHGGKKTQKLKIKKIKSHKKKLLRHKTRHTVNRL